VGADPRNAVAGAVAVELIHAFSLLHDDIIDGDRYRRHRPAAWTVFGVARAIVAGDALVPLAQRVLLDENVERSAAAARTLAEATATMIEGQADDMAFEGRNDVGVEECIVMAARKTGALLGAAAGLGGLLAGAGPGPVAALRHYGQSVGLAFQAVDDLLGIWGDPDRTGKPVGSDLRQGKKTIPVTIALAAGDRRSEELRSLLARRPLDDDDVQRAAALVEECGGRARTAAFADEQLSAALVDLDTIEPGPARDELAGLARFTVGRDR
jgi:geranylgeranyl diphosphate synthase type I